MKKFFIVSIVTVFIFTACQATPEEPVVIEKNLDSMTQMANENTEENAPVINLEVPERFVIDMDFPEVEVSADIPISLPNAQTLPVVRVTYTDFSQELVDKMWEVLIGDRPMYMARNRLSKEQIEADIIWWKSILAGETPGSHEQANEKIAELTAAYSSAEDTTPEIAATSQLVPQYDIDYETGDIWSEYIGINATSNADSIHSTPTSGVSYTFSVQNNYPGEGEIKVLEDSEHSYRAVNTKSRGATFSYNKFDYENTSNSEGMNRTNTDRININAFEIPENVTQPSMTYNEAVAIAQDFLDDIGVADYMSIEDERGSAEIVYYQEDSGGYSKKPEQLLSGEYNDDIIDVSYKIPVARMVHGVPVSALQGRSSIGDPDFGEGSWAYEYMILEIMGGEITTVYWVSPHEQLEVVASEASLLPFSEISAIFEKMVRVTYSAEHAKMRINIDRAELSLFRIMEQNDLENGLYVPVWTFYGDMYHFNEFYEEQLEWEDPYFEPEQWHKFEPDQSRIVLTINAVDGSIIDRGVGY